MDLRRVARFFVAVTVVASLASSGAVAAPPAGPGGSSPAGNESNSTTASAPNGTGSGYGPGTGVPDSATNGTGGGLFSVNPGQWVANFASGLASGGADLFNMFSSVIFGIDPPGVPGDISSWGPPETGLWVGAWALYWALAPLALAYLVVQWMRVQGAPSDREKSEKYGELGVSAAMILVGWPVAIGGLHLADGVALGFVPDAGTMFSTPGNVAKLGLTAALGGVMLIFQSGAVLSAVGVVLVERVVLIASVAGWPVWWSLRPSDGGFADTISGIGLSMYVGVAGAKVVQGALAYLILKSEWGIQGVGDTVMTLIGSTVGLLVTFIGVPLVVGRNFVPEMMTMFGTPAVEVAEDFASQNRERAGDAAKEYAAAAGSQARDYAPSAPSPTWGGNSARGGGTDASGDAAVEIPDGYTPSPEPGASTRGSGSASSNGSAGTSSSPSVGAEERINDRLGNKGRY